MEAVEKAKSFYNEHRTTILIGAVSLILGILVIGLNNWNYGNTTHIFETGPEDLTVEERTITEAQPFMVPFEVEEGRVFDSMSIYITFEEVPGTASFDVYFNDELTEDGLANVPSNVEQNIRPPPENVVRSNSIMLEGNFPVETSAIIESVRVEGYSNMQRYGHMILNMVGVVLAIAPLLVLKYRSFQKTAKIENRFPDFIRDLVEGVRSGMSLPQAISNTAENDYGHLTPYVKEMSARIEWGIPFDKVLRDFSEEIDSKIIKRAANTIIQSYKSGGNVGEVLSTVGSNIDKIKQLKSQRESELYGQMVTGYIVYFVFLGVMIALINYLLPAMTVGGDIPDVGGIGGMGGMGGVDEMLSMYRPIFRNLVVIQSVFSGLVIGKLSEGELKAGGKHVAILLTVGYIAAILFM